MIYEGDVARFDSRLVTPTRHIAAYTYTIYWNNIYYIPSAYSMEKKTSDMAHI